MFLIKNTPSFFEEGMQYMVCIRSVDKLVPFGIYILVNEKDILVNEKEEWILKHLFNPNRRWSSYRSLANCWSEWESERHSIYKISSFEKIKKKIFFIQKYHISNKNKLSHNERMLMLEMFNPCSEYYNCLTPIPIK